MSSWHEPLDRDGITILRSVYSPDLVQWVRGVSRQDPQSSS